MKEGSRDSVKAISIAPDTGAKPPDGGLAGIVAVGLEELGSVSADSTSIAYPPDHELNYVPGVGPKESRVVSARLRGARNPRTKLSPLDSPAVASSPEN